MSSNKSKKKVVRKAAVLMKAHNKHHFGGRKTTKVDMEGGTGYLKSITANARARAKAELGHSAKPPAPKKGSPPPRKRAKG